MSNYQQLHHKNRWLNKLNLVEIVTSVQNSNITHVAKELRVSRWVLQSYLNRNEFFQNRKFKRVEQSWNKGLTKVTNQNVLKNSVGTSRTVKEKYKNGYVNPFKGKHHTEEFKQLKSITEKQRILDHPELVEMNRRYGVLGYLAVPFMNTSIELKLQNELIKREIKFETQKPLLDLTVCDIFIEPNICIYADGDYWHNRSEAIKRDAYVNRGLEQNNYKAFRFWEHDINKDVKSCVDKVIEYIHTVKP
jgi:very-short-patch-repair endonuclease